MYDAHSTQLVGREPGRVASGQRDIAGHGERRAGGGGGGVVCSAYHRNHHVPRGHDPSWGQGGQLPLFYF